MPCNAGYAGHDWCKDKEVVHKDGDKEYCVFHAPKENKGISVGEFNTLVFAEINKAIADNRKCDLTGTVFPGDIYFRYANAENNLPEINFWNAHFNGEADFWAARFTGTAFFGGAEFTGTANFNRAEFTGTAFFGGAEFIGEAHFMSAHFTGGADFGGVQFTGEAYFSDAHFNGGADFSANFDSTAFFRGALFTGEVNFGFAQFTGGADFEGVHFDGVAFFKWLTIGGKIKFHNVNLDRASFMGTDLRLCEFITCTWFEKNGRYILQDETDYREEGNRRLWKSEDVRTGRVRDVENLYRTLKQKSREKFDEYQYSFWHMSEKEMQWERTTLRSSLRDWLVLFIYKYSSGYGEEPGRAFIWLGILCIIAFLLIPVSSIQISHGWDSARITIDYLTFRKPDEFVPKGFIGFLVSFISHIVIPIQAALTVLALRNRFRR